MVAFWTGLNGVRTRGLILGPLSVGGRAKSSRHAIVRGERSGPKDGPGPHLESAVALRAAASVTVGFFAVRRASEVPQVVTSNMNLDSD